MITKEFIKKIHDLPAKEIAKQIRKDLKIAFWKSFKFSVTTNSGACCSAINIAILSWNIQLYTKDYIEAKKQWDWLVCTELNKENKMFTKEWKRFIENVEKIHSRYNHDNSDVMTDYFDVNYYWTVEVGTRNKKYIKTE